MPLVEEVLKGIVLAWLIVKNKFRFMAQCLIYGAAIGSGFSLLENINVQLNERDRILKPKQGHTYVKNGFLPECKITDFPLRDRKMTLIVKRRRWKDAPHADQWLFYPENFGPRMSIDETSLSDGELYTVVTNKDKHGQKGALAAIIAGTKAEVVRAALDNVPEEKRNLVEEITMDLSPSMRNIAVYEFRNAKRVIDRFHIQKLACDAIQEMRIKHRWEAWTRSTTEKYG